MDIHKQIIIHASPQLVTDAFTQTRHTQAWWLGAQCYFDEAAGILSWRWPSANGGMAYLTHARLREYAAGVFIALDEVWQYDAEQASPIGPVSLLIEVTPQVNDSLLIIKHAGFRQDDAAWQDYAHAVQAGWDEVLPRLKEYLENLL